jgi:hypothetical protein
MGLDRWCSPRSYPGRVRGRNQTYKHGEQSWPERSIEQCADDEPACSTAERPGKSELYAGANESFKPCAAQPAGAEVVKVR